MFRAMRLLALLLAATVLFMLSNARAQNPEKVHNLIGMLDYTRPPDFKVGTWIRYSTEERSADGTSRNYRSTLLVPGEERFWGDDCFWVETWSEVAPDAWIASAGLLSYAIFQDSFPYPRMQYYLRKRTGGMTDGGELDEQVVERSVTSVRSRKWLPSRDEWKTDTLGADTVVTPIGSFQCVKVQLEKGTGITEDVRDSTVYIESREKRTVYYATGVPMTHIAREDIENTARRRAWRVGQSQEGAPFQLLQQGYVSSRVIERGDAGLQSMVLPPGRQKSLRQLFPAEFAGQTKPGTATSKSGSTTTKRR